jgi:GDP-4-dehydro-6-deoxy-D-mannose reductase
MASFLIGTQQRLRAAGDISVDAAIDGAISVSTHGDNRRAIFVPKALITGIGGFVGAYLTEHLHGLSYAVAGIDCGETCGLTGVAYHKLDILEAAGLTDLVASFAPKEVYHLAGISYLPDADASPMHAVRVNIMGTVSLLEAVRRSSPRARVLLVGSSKEYDNTIPHGPTSEDIRPKPTEFYGVSKFAAELLGLQYWRQFGMDVRISRSFNHTGPGQSPRFVCSDWARQIAEITLGRREPVVQVGNLDAEIDFTDVRDVVRAYRAILVKGGPGEVYNVCSGRAVSLRFILGYLTAKAGCPVKVASVEHKVRGHQTSPRLVGSSAKLSAVSQWRPEIPIEKTLDDIFDYWVHELTSKSK